MKKIFLKFLPLVFALTSCNLDPSDSEELRKMKSMVKEMLIDGESAQFSELRYYKSTNYGCGKVNAKNKFGAYVGEKKFIVSFDQHLAVIDSDREIPESPSKPYIASDASNNSILANMNYAIESAKWAEAIEKKSNLHAIFDAIITEKCTDTPSKQGMEQTNKEEHLKSKVEFVPYEEQDGFIAYYSDEYPFYAVNLAEALKPDLLKVLQPKSPIETSVEFANRSNYRALKSETVDLNRKYGFSLLSGYLFNKTEGFQVVYDADTETATIQSHRELCTDPARDPGRNPAIADSLKTIFGSVDEPIVKGTEYGITCNINSITSITFSSKQVDFLKYLQHQKGFEHYMQLKDSFKLPKQKLLELSTGSYSSDIFYIGIMIMGHVDVNLSISNFKDKTKNYSSNRAPSIPFKVSQIIYYNNKNGEILASRQIR